MNNHFKPHIKRMNRYQTSLGRDLDEGVRLDRNEKVSSFTPGQIDDIFGLFKGYSLSASPEAAPLYKAIADDLRLDEKKIFLANGITEGIRILYDLCAVPGDNVICLDPTYPMYKIYAEMYQIEYRKLAYDAKTLKPDLDTLYSQLDKRTKFVFLPNPNLPIESCFSVDELREMAKACRAAGAMLVVDEAYHYFGAPSALGLVDEFDNCLVFRTFSKAYGLAGLRIGFMVSNPAFIEYVSKSRSIVESNTLSMEIARYFVKHPELRDAHVKEVKKGAQYIQSELNKLGVRWYGGHYTNGLLIFLKSKKESEDVVAFLKARKIYIRGAFEPPFSETIRISIGPVSAMDRFNKGFGEWLATRKD